MAKKRDATYDRLIRVGLQDPFIRGIAGVVVIATAASIAISALGSGAKAIITSHYPCCSEWPSSFSEHS